ncbi:cysteine proteinase, partial [Teratosphaeria nubilosa]
WLNDETVNAWFAALVKKKNEQTGRVYKRGSAMVPHSATYNTMWFSNYKANGITAIKNWSRRKGIQGTALIKAEKVYFPINSGAHWTLLIISPTARTIEYLDSLGGKNRHAFTTARAWLAMELGDAFDPKEWTEVDGMSQQQKNGDDCGVFACVNGFASVKGVEFGRVESVKGMMDVRRWMVAVLLNGGFEGEFEL